MLSCADVCVCVCGFHTKDGCCISPLRLPPPPPFLPVCHLFVSAPMVRYLRTLPALVLLVSSCLQDCTHELIPFPTCPPCNESSVAQSAEAEVSTTTAATSASNAALDPAVVGASDLSPIPTCPTTPPSPPCCFLLAFSGLRAALTSTSGFNNRVEECRQAAALLLR